MLGLVVYQHFIKHLCVSWPESRAAASADNKKPGEASHKKKKMEERRKEQERERDRVDRFRWRYGRSDWSEI